MTFDQGNGIMADFDFCFYHESIPSGVDFKVEEMGDSYRLVGFGYGQHGGPDGAYGSGALYVSRSRLTPEQDARFRAALGYMVTWGGKVQTQGPRLTEGKP